MGDRATGSGGMGEDAVLSIYGLMVYNATRVLSAPHDNLHIIAGLATDAGNSAGGSHLC